MQIVGLWVYIEKAQFASLVLPNEGGFVYVMWYELENDGGWDLRPFGILRSIEW